MHSGMLLSSHHETLRLKQKKEKKRKIEKEKKIDTFSVVQSYSMYFFLNEVNKDLMKERAFSLDPY